MKIRNLAVIAASAAFALGTTGMASAASGPAEASTADISLTGCSLDSSKEISNIEYYSGGDSSWKDETVNALTYDLSTVEGIEDVDEVSVKAGTTVETFPVDCPTDDGGTGDDGTGDDGSGDGDAGDGGSAAAITLDECLLESTKEISNIEYFSGGESLWKDESVSALTYDLNSVEGIEDADEVSVKAGTTVETFPVDCPAEDDGSGDDGSGDDGTGSGADDGTATITLDECVLESTKDISNIEYSSGGVMLWKDESMNARSYDLSTVEGIDDVDEVTVKSGETIETFPVSCSYGGAA